MKEQIVEATICALKLVRNVRFFRTERGFQGEFFCELKRELSVFPVSEIRTDECIF